MIPRSALAPLGLDGMGHGAAEAAMTWAAALDGAGHVVALCHSADERRPASWAVYSRRPGQRDRVTWWVSVDLRGRVSIRSDILAVVERQPERRAA